MDTLSTAAVTGINKVPLWIQMLVLTVITMAPVFYLIDAAVAPVTGKARIEKVTKVGWETHVQLSFWKYRDCDFASMSVGVKLGDDAMAEVVWRDFMKQNPKRENHRDVGLHRMTLVVETLAPVDRWTIRTLHECWFGWKTPTILHP